MNKTTATWRDKQDSMPVPLEEALKAWKESPRTNELQRMEDAIDAYEEATTLCQQCDEPGCTQPAGIGYPVPGGYRRTCSKHIDKEAP